MTIFDEMLAIKRFREDKAESNVRRQKPVVQQATDHLIEQERVLADWQQYSVRQELMLFDDLCSRTVRLADIEHVQHEIAFMRERERGYINEVEAAEKNRDKELAELDERKSVHAHATRAKEKFIELARVHGEELSALAERKEDAEMEEVNESRRERNELDDLLMPEPI